MRQSPQLTQDQQDRIKATLARIRGALRSGSGLSNREPAHVFLAEVSDESQD
jgi:hypothetical protein